MIRKQNYSVLVAKGDKGTSNQLFATFIVSLSMQKTFNKSKTSSVKSKTAYPTPVISKATTKNKDEALNNVIGMWANQEEVKDIKTFREALWRKKAD